MNFQDSSQDATHTLLSATDSMQPTKLPWQTPEVIVHEVVSSTKGLGGNTGDGITNLC